MYSSGDGADDLRDTKNVSPIKIITFPDTVEISIKCSLPQLPDQCCLTSVLAFFPLITNFLCKALFSLKKRELIKEL